MDMCLLANVLLHGQIMLPVDTTMFTKDYAQYTETEKNTDGCTESFHIMHSTQSYR